MLPERQTAGVGEAHANAVVQFAIFLDQGTYPTTYRFSWSHLVFLLGYGFLLAGATATKIARGSVISNPIGMKFATIVPWVNMHRLTESDFGYDVTLSRWRQWRHFVQIIILLQSPPFLQFAWRMKIIHSVYRRRSTGTAVTSFRTRNRPTWSPVIRTFYMIQYQHCIIERSPISLSSLLTRLSV